MITKLANKWGVSEDACRDILRALDAQKWLGGETLESITHAGVIDNDSTADKLSGHTGYWISDGEHIALVTNGDPVWSTLNDEDACRDAGLQWGEPEEMLAGHEL
jgi:hypothetical protein